MSRPSALVRLAILAWLVAATPAWAADPIKILFLGDDGHHRPAERFAQLAPALKQHGIELTYTDKMSDLNADTLNKYAGLMIYANTVEIKPDQEKALLEYVESGHGLIPLHCASFCFQNSRKYVDLVGAQFQRHGVGTFRTTIAEPDHELIKGFKGFESWDETYVHSKHNKEERTVLEYREDKDGKEPWTWVRTQGKGRVFYTAWGHDQRTFSNPGFHNLVERGVRWAVHQDPQVAGAFSDKSSTQKPAMTPKRTDVKPFEYVNDARIPFYPPSRQWGVQAEPQSKMQKPLDPAESQKHYTMPQGFELQLFAAEPQIGKPIAMTWDERGRLWVAETTDYPNEKQPEGEGRDRIRICEDTDGDGKADKFTIFAEKLSIPTSLILANGGVIVHQAPQTLFLKDTDGDDVADVKKTLFTGWSVGDTHAGPSNLNYGFDNWLYGMVGYAGFEGTIGGERQSFRTGFYRFKPDGSKFEFLRNTNNNSWGVGFSEDGTLFGSTANGNPSEYMPIPNRYYEGVRGWSSSVLGGIAGNPRFEPSTENIRQVDQHGGFTAAAGHALYTARQYPQEYWNRTAFVAEPTGHLLATFVIDQQGAGYKSRMGWSQLASDDEWSSPIVAEVGPDGNVWVIDWYNYIVQHNPTPAGFKNGKGNAYETPARDKTHGRIYRLVYKDAKPASTISLKDASPEKLVATLTNDNLFWRRQAQRLLVERGKDDVVPQLVALVQDQKLDAVGNNPGAMHALWTLQGLGAMNKSVASDAAVQALAHPAAAVRRAAIQVLPRDSKLTGKVAAKATDSDGQVRLAAFLALSESPPADEAAKAIVAALANPEVLADRWLLDAVTAAAAGQDVAFLRAYAALGEKAPNKPEALARLAIVAQHFARGTPTDSVGALIVDLKSASAPVADTIIIGLLKGWPKNKAPKLDTAGDDALARLFTKLTPAGRAALVSLTERWENKSLEKYTAQIAEGFVATVQDTAKKDEERVSAAAQLVDFKRFDAKVAELLLAQFNAKMSPELGRGLIEALGKSETADAGALLVERLGAITPQVRPTAVKVLLSRGDWTLAMIQGIEAGKLQFSDLALDQRQALAVHPDKKIADRAKKLLAAGGGLPNPDRQKVLDELLPLTKLHGDPVAGKVVFKAQCAKCHTHSGEGTKVGPDLTGMAVHPKHELLTHIIDPSRSVEGNFRVYTAATEDGRVLTGLLASETKTAIELIDAEGKKQTILREDIDELVASPKSLMPEGFEKQVKSEDISNLLEFLTQRGKFVPIALDKFATINTTKGMFYSEDADLERLIFSDWSAKTFEGVPFQLVDPKKDTISNAIMLYGPSGAFPPKMPKTVTLPCNTPAKAIHLLSGISGWGFPASDKGSQSMIIRLHYADGKTEDHELLNGEHFADYIRRVDVPKSKFAFGLRGQQLRYLAVLPQRAEAIETIELVKGKDGSAPVVMAVTIETQAAAPH